MPTLKWNLLTEPAFRMSDTLVTVPWVRVLDTQRDYTHLRIASAGTWTQQDSAFGECGPDGFTSGSLQSDRLLVADCPTGALIGKIGGSSASLSTPATPAADDDATAKVIAEGKAFAIGSYCVIPLPSKFIGPLFVNFNGLMRPINVAKLEITVEGATTS